MSQSENEWMIISGGLGVGKTTRVSSGDCFYGCFAPTTAEGNLLSTSFQAFRSALHAYTQQICKEDTNIFNFDFDSADINELIEVFPCLSALFGDRHEPSQITSNKRLSMSYGEGLVMNHVPASTMFHIGLPDLLVRLFKTLPAVRGRFVLEDWHWADEQSVEILQAMFDNRKDIKCKIVCTYRDDDCLDESCAAWKALLNRVLLAAETDMMVRSIKLHEWTETQICSWLEERYKVAEGLQHLAQLIMQRTKGSPLFSYLFMELLVQEEIIKCPKPSDHQASFEEAELCTKVIFDHNFETSLPTTLTQCIHRMAMNKRETLGTIKCFAAALKENPDECINQQLLSIMSNQSIEQVECHLRQLPCFFNFARHISFKHREILKHILTMVTEDEIARVHKENGIRLWHYYNQTIEDHASILRLTVQQLRLGSTYIEEPSEVSVFASLCLKAGEQAMGSSRFPQARSYFHHAIEQLGPWTKENHDALLTFHNLAAEASYAAGDIKRMDFHLKTVFEHANSSKDSMRARCTQIFANGAKHNPTSVEDTLSLLKDFGSNLPSNPSSIMVLYEFLKTRWLLRNTSDIDFLQLPLATDPDAIALMQVLLFGFTSFYPSRPNLALFTAFRSIQLTLKYGVTGPAIAALSTYAFLLCAAFGWIDEAYRYGKICLQMGQHFSARPYLARCGLAFYGYISQWTTPFRDHFVPLKEMYRLALQTGDMESATFGCAIIADLSVHLGRPLRQVEKETRSFCHAMDRLHQLTGLAITMVIYSFIACDLLGQSVPDLNLKGPVRDVESARSLTRDASDASAAGISSDYVEFLFLSLKTMFLCLTGRYAESAEMASRSYKAFQSETNPNLMFFEGVSSLAASRSSSARSSIWLRRRGKRLCRIFGRWAKRCPSNYYGKYSLMMAELSACRRRSLQALRWYEKSIAWSSKETLTVDEGLANACLGDYLRETGCHSLAIASYVNAKESYERWGAISIVKHIELIISKEKGYISPEQD